ncbi:signal recognition particle-docking protein FtsY [Pseudomonas sp. PDM22]|uniref:signal recognition particle-docking protein FtsY n=1 Tax=Pseudomonas sp. PDM22 TaxID=2769287 RepID=UPI0009DA3B36|nr:signal recognition particle-docking protein FtsY [Pseudomonas sp. PDM22]MBD9514583.1 signal recognition particle-docking protein FtsY [Pseudomonas sp. PDM22]OQR30730.1 signal recognition particle-docking protein FtsY [Pseudomonas sp. T]
MFGSNDDKKAPPAGEKKGLFGWWRKKPQAEEQPAAQAEPQAEQPVAAEPAPAPEQAPAVQAEPVAPRAELTPEPTPEPIVDVVPASVPVEPLAQPALQPEAQPAPQPEPQPVAPPVVAEAPQPAVQPVAAPVQPEPVAEAPVVVVQPEPEPAPQPEPEPQAKPAASEPAKIGFFARLKQGLSKTSASLGEGMASLFLGKKAIDDDLLDEIETRLLTADVGVEATTTIVQNLTKRVARKELADSEALYKALQEELAGLLRPVEQPLTITTDKQPYVILVVGVNGVGKTTTIGKLAKKLQLDGKKVMLAAGDTFRAAAVEQLQVWGERNNIAVIAQHTGADSASVIFDAVQAAKARGVDVLIADTAGRLHTKDNLMEELKKVRRVIGKLDETAPHEVLLVLDAGTGQNAINQAKQFNNAVELTGLALTKLDGTAKGGVIFALAKQFGLPIRYIGVGEGIDDLRTFEADAFVRALFETREIA